MRTDDVYSADGELISSVEIEEAPPSALDACDAFADAVTLEEMRDAASSLRKALEFQGIW